MVTHHFEHHRPTAPPGPSLPSFSSGGVSSSNSSHPTRQEAVAISIAYAPPPPLWCPCSDHSQFFLYHTINSSSFLFVSTIITIAVATSTTSHHPLSPVLLREPVAWKPGRYSVAHPRGSYIYIYLPWQLLFFSTFYVAWCLLGVVTPLPLDPYVVSGGRLGQRKNFLHKTNSSVHGNDGQQL